MNKSQFVAEIADQMDVPKAAAKAYVEAFEEVVVSTVKRGEAVTLTGFVKFSRKDVPARKARKGTNPFTGEETTFKARPATKKPRVTPLKAFKDTVAKARR